MRWLAVFLSTYMVGYLFFFTFERIEWMGYDKMVKIWGVWNNFSYASILALICIRAVGNKDVKIIVLPVLIFSYVMCAWELTSTFTGIHINNKWAEMAVFLVLIFVVSYFMFRGFRKIEEKHF